MTAVLWCKWAHTTDLFKLIMRCKTLESYCTSGMNLLVAPELNILLKQ